MPDKAELIDVTSYILACICTDVTAWVSKLFIRFSILSNWGVIASMIFPTSTFSSFLLFVYRLSRF